MERQMNVRQKSNNVKIFDKRFIRFIRQYNVLLGAQKSNPLFSYLKGSKDQ